MKWLNIKKEDVMAYWDGHMKEAKGKLTPFLVQFSLHHN